MRHPLLTVFRNWALPLILIVCAAWPWWGLLSMPPMAADAPEILAKTDPLGEGWLRYALETAHFGVAWRPLMMLSFSLDMALGGVSLGLLRGTDLLLHLVAALGVFALGSRLGEGRRVAWLALALYLLHPALDEIVPFLPRRGYTMCAALCLPAMSIALDTKASWGRGLIAGVLFVLGLASHEIASFFLLGTLLLSFALDEGQGASMRLVRASKRILPAAILTGLLLFQRGEVLGRLGGYGTEDRALSVVEFTQALSQGLLSLQGTWSLVGFGSLLALLLLRACIGQGQGRSIAWAMILWISVSTGILGFQGVWFPRIAYSILPMLALALAWLVLESPRLRIARLGAVFLCVPFLLESPVLRGPDGPRQEVRAARKTLIRDLEDAAARVLALTEEPAVLRLVLPFHRGEGRLEGRGKAAGRVLPRDARQPWRWVGGQLDQERLVLEPWLYIEEPSSSWNAEIKIDRSNASLQLELPLEREILRMGVSTARRRPGNAGPRETWRPSRAHGDRRQFLFVYKAAGENLISL